MRFFKNLVFYVFTLFMHFLLLYLFANTYYLLYFILIFLSSYILHTYYRYFNSFIFLASLFLIVLLVNLDSYDEFIFDFFLKFNLLSRTTYLNNELIYILTTLHTIILLNLKKFESFWDIIDEKL